MTNMIRIAWNRYFAAVLMIAYCLIFLIRPLTWLPAFVFTVASAAQRTGVASVDRLLAGCGLPATFEWRAGAYLLVFAGLLPLVLARIAGRGLRDVGWNVPNRFAWRYFWVAMAVSLPFLVWMVQSPTMSLPYVEHWERVGGLTFCLYYVLNMFTEHVLIHGVVLGLSTPGGRWPKVEPPAKTDRGILAWLGLTTVGSDGPRRFGWGLPAGCLMPIAISALLFGGVHLGKDYRELVLSFPGGLAQAYIALRSGSWLTPFGIHLATATTALGMMLWFR
jgi:hypothetical protein